MDPLSLLIGGGITWVVSHPYSRRSTAEIREAMGKLPDEFVRRLTGDARPKLDYDDLVEMVMQTGYPTEFGIVPHTCPKCGSTNIKIEGYEGHDGDYGASSWCDDCGWSAF